MKGLLCEGITKSFASNRNVLNQIDLTLPEGEFCCLLGPSGCGKSTLLRIIAGLETPNSGRIELDGRPLTDSRNGIFVPPHRRGIGFVFQQAALWPHLTVRQNVGFGLRYQRLSSARRRTAIDEALAQLAIAPLANRYPSGLSGGERQRVSIARMLVLRPSLSLFDEPLSSLDALLRREFRLEIGRIHRRYGMTSVMVTHDQDDAFELASYVVLMNHGTILQSGSPLNLYREPRTLEVARFIGTPEINAWPAASKLGHRLCNALFSSPGTCRPTTAAATIACRPEQIRVARDRWGAPEGPVPLAVLVNGTIARVIQFGTHQELEIHADSDVLRVYTHSKEPFMVGALITAYIARDDLLAFDDTGTRICL